MFLVIFDHLFYDITYKISDIFKNYPGDNAFFKSIVSFGNYYWYSDIRFHVRNVAVFCFAFLIGVCCSFSKNNLKRGLKLGVAAILSTAVTLVSCIIMNDINLTISFGILHCAVLSLIIIGLLEKITDNNWVYWQYLLL